MTKKLKKLSNNIKELKRLDSVKKYLDRRSPQWLNYAKGIAPMKTGAIRENIMLTSLSTFNNVIYRITAFQPENLRGRPYMMWQHGLKNIKGPNGKGYDLRTGKFAPKSGVPDFMFKLHERISDELKVDQVSHLINDEVKNKLKI